MYVNVCVCVCVCVCARARARETETESDRERERVCVCVCVLSVWLEGGIEWELKSKALSHRKLAYTPTPKDSF